MSDEPTCYCGHVRDEHLRTKTGYGRCDVDDCPCIHYEENPEVPSDAPDSSPKVAGIACVWLDANCPECGAGNSIAVASRLPWLCGACGRSLIAPLAGRPSGTGSATTKRHATVAEIVGLIHYGARPRQSTGDVNDGSD